MTDIVEALRRMHTTRDGIEILSICGEAADEIERLRARVALMDDTYWMAQLAKSTASERARCVAIVRRHEITDWGLSATEIAIDQIAKKLEADDDR